MRPLQNPLKIIRDDIDNLYDLFSFHKDQCEKIMSEILRMCGEMGENETPSKFTYISPTKILDRGTAILIAQKENIEIPYTPSVDYSQLEKRLKELELWDKLVRDYPELYKEKKGYIRGGKKE